MPEGDTVWLSAHRLDQALRGRIVTTFDLRVPSAALADQRGDTVREVVARGKHILMRLDSDLTLHSHLRMDGTWHISPADRPSRAHPEYQIRALIGNDTWLATGFRVHDLRMVRTDDEATVVGHLGPDLLGPDWDAEVAEARLRADPGYEIGEALLDQTKLAGIGNMYKSEVLFIQRVNPWRTVAEVEDLAALLATAQRLLRVNRDRPEQTTTGQLGRDRDHWVYLRAGRPCRRCGTRIESAEQGSAPRQRSTYWCPRCQPEAGRL